jgi:branched-chain amino acid aminotransferase
VSDISVWRITAAQNIQLETDASSLDEVTRRLPEGYFSTFRTLGGGRRVLGLSAHLRRLYDPVPTPQVNEPFLRRQLSALLEPYRPKEARLRVVMTRSGEVYVALEPFLHLPQEIYENGVAVETTELQREDPRLKSTAFIGRSVWERDHIAQAGVFEALLVKDRKILEGMTSNFFYVAQVDKLPYLGTAGEEILLGITRETVIELAHQEGLKVEYKPLRLDGIEAVQEAFITSSSRGIVPVVEIDTIPIGQGRPGPITQRLIAAY